MEGVAAVSELYHYTCDHGHRLIDRYVVPGDSLGRYDLDGPHIYAWFTDLARPLRDALGLTSTILSCDRTQHRYRVTDRRDLIHWRHVRRDHAWAIDLESAPGARLMHWWVARHPVPVVYDPIRGAA